MTYPPAPWNLRGYAVQTLHLIDIENARPFVPSELDIVSVFPGKTIGGIYVSSYQSGSTLEYNELIVISGLVRYREKIGSWISHIYVDNEDSVAGGREIWGLPKEMAEFTLLQNRIDVRQSDRQLCFLRYQRGMFSLSTWWRQSLSTDVFGGLDSQLLLFTGRVKSQFELVDGYLDIPSESPFARLNLGQPFLSVYCQQLELIAGEPTIIGMKEPQYSC
jgi:acetoacetate decarboxylase